ncbi:MAG: beta-xylosidase [Anaerolineaceae bacterium]|nr:beta-xylosidase [Anaerolineaceae bacterium]
MSNHTQIKIDRNKEGEPLNPYWKVCVGGGRVGEALRADFQKHLEMVQREMPFDYIRMHGLFHEDMMVYREVDGQPILNWQYVDLVYDHWLSIGIRPFVELGFMPYDLASGEETVFWWKGNITPPKDWDRWEWFIKQFVLHVVERYGIEEVRRWYFEVWNEPDLDFFWKDADFEAYMKLYEYSVRAIKQVDEQLKVGGPATASASTPPGHASWGKEFLEVCTERKLPVDFFSTHPYPTFHPFDPDGVGYMTWDGPERLMIDLVGYEKTLEETGYAHLEKHHTEWSSSPSPRDPTHDTAFLAPFLVQNNLAGRGHADSLSFWVVSDIFEESRQGDTPFHGGFGLVNVQGLKKPSYHGYWFLSRLGDELLELGDGYAVTRHSSGKISVVMWNYCHYTEEANDSRTIQNAVGTPELYGMFQDDPAKEFTVTLPGLEDGVRIETTVFDREHGSVLDAWFEMGSPNHILREDLEVLRQQMELETIVERLPAQSDPFTWTFTVQQHGVTLIDITASAS